MANLQEVEMQPPREDPAAIYAEKGPDGQPAQAAPVIKKKKCCEKKSRFQKNSEKYGEKMTEFKLSEKSEFKDGMVMERKRTDVAFGIVFVVFFLVWIGIDVYGLTTQDATRTYAPLDAGHKFCGMGAGRTDYKYLYFTSIAGTEAQMFSSAVCVKECPTAAAATGPACLPVPQTVSVQAVSCPTTSYATQQIFSICTPTEAAFANGTPEQKAAASILLKAKEKAGGLTTAFKLCTWQIIVCLILAVVGNILYIYAMSRFAETLAKISIVLIELFFVAMIAGLVYATTSVTGAGQIAQQRQMGFMVAALVVVLMFAFFNCMLYCYYTQFQVAIAVVDAAADFFADTKRIILVSMLHFVLGLAFLVLWLSAAASIYGMNDFKYDPNFGDKGQGRLPIWNTGVTVMLAIKIFVIIWVLQTLSNQLVYVTMVAASTYYFDSNSEKEGQGNITLGLKWAYGANFGSIAFGSLVQAILTILREGLEGAADSDSSEGAAGVVKCVAVCLLRCVEGIVDYVNKLALAQVAITGEPYCQSAWNGFMVNLQHCAKFYFAQDVGRFFVNMGVLSVAAANTGIFYLLAQTATYPDGITFIAPLAFVAVMSLAIGALILGLFDEAIMATLHCLALDMDVNGGVPKWGPPTFHEKMEKILAEDGPEKVADDGVMGANPIN